MFAGEDLNKSNRVKAQQAQQRNWIEQQVSVFYFSDAVYYNVSAVYCFFFIIYYLSVLIISICFDAMQMHIYVDEMMIHYDFNSPRSDADPAGVDSNLE